MLVNFNHIINVSLIRYCDIKIRNVIALGLAFICISASAPAWFHSTRTPDFEKLSEKVSPYKFSDVTDFLGVDALPSLQEPSPLSSACINSFKGLLEDSVFNNRLAREKPMLGSVRLLALCKSELE